MTCEQGLLRLLWGGCRSWSATALYGRVVFQGFPLEYSSIACQTKCSHQQQEKFVCHEQHFVFTLIHLRLLQCCSSTNSFRWQSVTNVTKEVLNMRIVKLVQRNISRQKSLGYLFNKIVITVP